MNSKNYKRLGDYIEAVNIRNVDNVYGVEELRGVNNEGKIMQSKANIVGVDFNTYKIAHKGYFIYNPARLDIGSLSCLQEETAIFSQMYVVFKVKEDCTNVLLTDFLWLWLKRKEFYRYVGFINFGSVREMFTYDDMCNVMLPVPSIEEQRRIVNEYQTVERRIANNEKLIQKLEETAQAIYYHTFVEGIDENNLPEGWRMGFLRDLVSTQYGYTATTITDDSKPKILRITDIVPKSIAWEDVPNCEIEENEIETYRLYEGDMVVSRTGQNIGYAKQIIAPFPDSVFASFLVRLKAKSSIYNWFLGVLIESQNYKDFIFANQQGSAQPQANPQVMTSYPLAIPQDDTLILFNKRVYPILKYRRILEKEKSHLRELLSLLTSKLA